MLDLANEAGQAATFSTLVVWFVVSDLDPARERDVVEPSATSSWPLAGGTRLAVSLSEDATVGLSVSSAPDRSSNHGRTRSADVGFAGAPNEIALLVSLQPQPGVSHDRIDRLVGAGARVGALATKCTPTRAGLAPRLTIASASIPAWTSPDACSLRWRHATGDT